MAQSRTSNVLGLSLGKVLTTVLLMSAMVSSRLLTEAELATFRQTMLAYEVAMPILCLGLTNGIYYYLPTETFRTSGLLLDATFLLLIAGIIYADFIVMGGNELLA